MIHAAWHLVYPCPDSPSQQEPGHSSEPLGPQTESKATLLQLAGREREYSPTLEKNQCFLLTYNRNVKRRIREGHLANVHYCPLQPTEILVPLLHDFDCLGGEVDIDLVPISRVIQVCCQSPVEVSKAS